jgi:4-hydroxy-2-oxoheptanedioate aldolase
MFPNRLKALWATGKPALNAWCSIGSSFSAEIIAAQGFDSVTVDMQHGALDYAALLPMFQAMRASGAMLMARVPWLEPGIVMKALDAGAQGIICPMVNTAADAALFVSYMRYPPDGQRSFGPTRAAYAAGPDYVTQANSGILAFAMVETAEAFGNLESIAATPGLDGIYVGPADLTFSMSAGRLLPGTDREEPEMIAAIRRIADVCRKNGIRAGLHCGTPDYAAKAVGWGFDLVTVGGDVAFLAGGAATAVGGFRRLTGGAAPDSRKSVY